MYTQDMTRKTPGLVVFLVDQSASMSESADGPSKADRLSAVLNNAIDSLVVRCVRDEGIRDLLSLSAIGYTTDSSGMPVIGQILGPWASAGPTPISVVEANATVVEREVKKLNQAGEWVTSRVKKRVWVQPHAAFGTPMCQALEYTTKVLAKWTAANACCPSPVVLHITDGDSQDGDPTAAAMALMKLHTDDGKVMLFNCHLSLDENNLIAYPNSDAPFRDDAFAARLFAMSSPLTDAMVRMARSHQINVTTGARGFLMNAGFNDLERFLKIGTPEVKPRSAEVELRSQEVKPLSLNDRTDLR